MTKVKSSSEVRLAGSNDLRGHCTGSPLLPEGCLTNGACWHPDQPLSTGPHGLPARNHCLIGAHGLPIGLLQMLEASGRRPRGEKLDLGFPPGWYPEVPPKTSFAVNYCPKYSLTDSGQCSPPSRGDEYYHVLIEQGKKALIRSGDSI